jgi:7-cyano-7-deazaguanine synthase
MDRVASVILLSGGLDSAANLAFCARRDEPVLALTLDYGQRAAQPEIRAARALCRHYGVEHQVLDARWLGALGGSALTELEKALPRLGTEELDLLESTRESARSVWVPNRNGVFIEIAAAHAERRGCGRVVVGFNREEAATFPDNTIEYLRRVSAALGFSTANGVSVHSYTAEWEKREIVAALRAEDPSFPFELLWSCYEGGARPCGSCESCLRLARAIGGTR